MVLKKINLIEKRNVLNEMRSNSMTLQEIRFLSIYLSKINARKPETRIVKFPVTDFLKIMEIEKVNIYALKEVSDRLLCKVVSTSTVNGGFVSFQLFKECVVDKEPDTDEWYVTIDAHDRALPLFFDFKRDYFTYELWNALRLKSSNQIRMYETLKQHQKQGEWTYTLDELREQLYISKDEYPRFQNFQSRVLVSCQKALAENTDISFDYELIKKGAKVISVKFKINKNSNYIDQMTLWDFVNKDDIDQYILVPKAEKKFQNEHLEFLADACDNEFSEESMQILYDLIAKIIPYTGNKNDTELERFDYLHSKYHEMQVKKPSKSRFGYLKAIIKVDVEA